MKLPKLLVLIATGVWFGSGTASRPASLLVSPAVLTNDYENSINLGIADLKISQVLVEKYLDLNANGLVETDEPLVQSFSLSDAGVFSIGGVRDPNVPGDEFTKQETYETRINKAFVARHLRCPHAQRRRHGLRTNHDILEHGDSSH